MDMECKNWGKETFRGSACEIPCVVWWRNHERVRVSSLPTFYRMQYKCSGPMASFRGMNQEREKHKLHFCGI
jgi:hypothetical protein